MKIAVYCQHVLGIGHFMRTILLCRALEKHGVILITGGEPVELALPSHMREIRLPSLMMDTDFQNLHDPRQQNATEKVKALRAAELMDIFRKEAPDLLIIELYPFGRKAFRFELDPLLESIRSGALPPCHILCSVRDILVEKEKAAAHEKRALNILNTFFNAVLIHADPKVITLDRTFGPFGKIKIPVVYTGYVGAPSPAVDRSTLRRQLGLDPSDRLVVVSAGGGKVGGPLLEAIAAAPQFLPPKSAIRFLIFAGPFAEAQVFAKLELAASQHFMVRRFAADFTSYLAAADLSISMAGYNTCMNLLAARVPALVLPFAQNREQQLRARRLADLGALDLLTPENLNPRRLAEIIESALARPSQSFPAVDLDGAQATARWVDRFFVENQKGGRG